MYSIAKFFTRTGRIGKPLSSPYPVFDAENVRFRYGATSMIAGKPGSFKSVLALNMLWRWAQEGLSGVYFSADSDERTVAARLSAIGSGDAFTAVDAAYEARRFGLYQKYLSQMSAVRFEYRAQDVDGIANLLAAYEAVSGSYPDIVFVDNLMDFVESPTDYDGQMRFLVEMDALAREAKSHICILHHASENYGDAADPVPRKAIQNKVTQKVRVCLTTAANERAMAVACVKNTNGPQFPDATRIMQFHVQDSLRVTDDYREAL